MTLSCTPVAMVMTIKYVTHNEAKVMTSHENALLVFTNQSSRVAQWERAGPITQRSMDRNHPLLSTFFFLSLLLL